MTTELGTWYSTKDKPYGMQYYKSWYRPEGVDPKKRPTDVDGLLHNRNGNRFLMMEMKPSPEVSYSQSLTLESFSRKEDCTSLLIEDKYSDVQAPEHIEDTLDFIVTVWIQGQPRQYTTTILQLNTAIAYWFSGSGWLIKHPES